MKFCSKRSPHRFQTQAAIRERGAFTLVEMMISVALVLLMMVMFAQVFQMAGGSIGQMRGLAENDQRARTMQTILKADLDKRTFRWVYPFAANESTGAAGANMANRQGYFYISENNPNNDLDDVIQFTVMSTITIRNTDITPYYGQAANLAPFTFPNQPDADDAQLVPNNTGLSSVAEVAYFVRNGNLYRRQLLIREPLPIISQLGVAGGQPTDGSVQFPSVNNPFNPYIPAGNPTPAYQYSAFGPFWNDFDYSAYLTHTLTPAPNYTGAKFVGYASLDNSISSTTGISWPANAIGSPAQRFGFSPSGVPAVNAPGRPKEFGLDTSSSAVNPTTGYSSTDANVSDFLGRFTLQECSDPNFIYPQNLSVGNVVPVDPQTTWLFNQTDGSVIDFPSGTRRGEDLILANVHSFDIQVWDSTAQSFVNLGDPGLNGSSADYQFANRYGSGQGTPPSPSYGPRLLENVGNFAINSVFDTWHPQIDLDTANDPSPPPTPPINTSTGQTIYDDPPYRPLVFRPTSFNSPSPLSGSSVGFHGTWAPNTAYSVGAIVFPSGPPGTTIMPPLVTTANLAKLPYGAPFYYRCVQPGTSFNNTVHPYDNEPAWPQIEGITVMDNNVIWQAVDNRLPLKAIQIQIRYLDTSSQQMRQLTIVQSFVDSN